MKKKKCWDFFQCNEIDCPVFQEKDLRCWLYSGTHCRHEIQGKFLEKMEMCLDCIVFTSNMDAPSMKETLKVVNKQFAEFRQIVTDRDTELENMSIEMALGLSEVFEALKKISSGDPTVRIPDISEVELISKLKQVVNATAEDIGEIVDQSHEIAMCLAEHFDVLHRVSKGDMDARVTGESEIDLLESLKNVTNETVASISREISERKKAEDDIKQALSLLNATLESTADGILVVDKNGKIVSFNQKFAQMWRIPEAVLSSRANNMALSYILDQLKDTEGFLVKVRELYSRPESESFDILEFKDGRVFERFSQSQKIGDTIAGRVWSFRDVTKRRQAEDALRQMEALESSILSTIPHAVIGLKNRKIIFANDAVEHVFGWKPEELIDNGTRVLYRNDDEFEEIGSHFYPVLEKKRCYSEEFPCRRKDGSDILCRVNATVIGDRLEERQIVVMYEDISERKKLEVQLVQAQKMEAVGTLAGGVAHDFNNILTAIISYANLMLMKMDKKDPLKTYLERILNSSERASNLVHSLLAFSRKQIIDPKPIDVNNIIRKIRNLLMRLIGEDIELRIKLADKGLVVMADAGQMEQVLMNLATNARDAMPDVGIFSIITELVRLDDEFIDTHGYGNPGTYALVTVSDTGGGMDEDTRERIFEPFFTTKGVGKGTGLGLSIVYGIIKQHNGFINCYSESEKGTTFRIYLPLIKTKEFKETKSAEIPSLRTGSETILLAEDNAEVRSAAKEILSESGYEVIEAVDGEDAIHEFMRKRDGQKIKLLILDVIMPKKNGKEVYEAIKEIEPDIKVLFASGYPADIIHKKGILERDMNFILKPFSSREFLRKVREVLDRQR